MLAKEVLLKIHIQQLEEAVPQQIAEVYTITEGVTDLLETP